MFVGLSHRSFGRSPDVRALLAIPRCSTFNVRTFVLPAAFSARQRLQWICTRVSVRRQRGMIRPDQTSVRSQTFLPDWHIPELSPAPAVWVCIDRGNQSLLVQSGCVLRLFRASKPCKGVHAACFHRANPQRSHACEFYLAEGLGLYPCQGVVVE